MGAWKRFTEFFRTRRLDRDLDDEVGFHISMLEDEYRAKGMDPRAARNAARRDFGGAAQAKEAYRDGRGLPWMETLDKDIRYALRGLRRSPGFTAAAVLSLALGIGANTAIFSMFHTLMMRMLPVSNPQQLVLMYRTGAWGRGFSSYPLYREIAKRTDLFSGVLARSGIEKVRFGSGGQETVWREFVSGNYFSLLGVRPAIGRVFTDDDNRTPHAHPLAVLNYDFWQSRFGGDSGVLGRKLLVDNQSLTIIGVAARGFRGIDLDRRANLWVPAMMNPETFQMAGKAVDVIDFPGSFWVWIVARCRPGIPHQQVEAAMNVLLKQHLSTVYGENKNAAFRRQAMAQTIEVRDAGVGLSNLRDEFGKPLTILMAAVGLVLLAACANVAHLLLARGAARQKEIALRFSIGATRWRLVRQALVESLILAACGCALGVLLAIWGERSILQFLPASAGQPFDLTPERAVLAFTLAISVLSAVLFGLVPALRSTALDPAVELHAGMGRAGERRHVLRRGLVLAQVAFSVVLVALAGLFSHSLWALRSVNLGFRNQNVAAFEIDFPEKWTPAQVTTAREQFLNRLRAMPGVSAVGFGMPGPFLGGYSQSSINVPGSETAAREPAWVNLQVIDPDYFSVLGSTMLYGRGFDRTDAEKSRKVAIVNEAFLRKFLPGETHPLEHPLSFDGRNPTDYTYIVGVVHDIAHLGLREPVPPTVYRPISQVSYNFGNVVLASALPPKSLADAIRREVAAMGPQVTSYDVETIRQRIDDSIFQDRLLATVGGFFGILALLLAAVGLYGVVAFGTARRAGEIGIRIALGAQRPAVLWMVLRDALLLVCAGLVVGLPAGFVAARSVASILYGIKPADPIALGSTGCVLLAAGLAAAFLPARRAAGMDPMHALRHE